MTRPVDPRLVRALTRRLETRRAALEAGAEHIGCAAANGNRVLSAAGETVRAGDRLISGSVVHVLVTPGDRVAADPGPLGAAGLEIAGA